jgi:hypothetical protein
MQHPVLVAAVAGVGNAKFQGALGLRYAEAVVAPIIHAHVGSRWHVAIDAGSPGAARCVVMVGRGVEYGRLVALCAQCIALGQHCATVRFMAVGASHPSLVHPALQERSVNVSFIMHLPVGKVHVLLEKAQLEQV